MTALADATYAVLRALLLRGQTFITYGQLAAALRRRRFGTMHPRNHALHAALGEIVWRCRVIGLPFISAIVWRGDWRRPGAAYYQVAHQAAKSPIARWRREHARVLQATYPPTI